MPNPAIRALGSKAKNTISHTGVTERTLWGLGREWTLDTHDQAQRFPEALISVERDSARSVLAVYRAQDSGAARRPCNRQKL